MYTHTLLVVCYLPVYIPCRDDTSAVQSSIEAVDMPQDAVRAAALIQQHYRRSLSRRGSSLAIGASATATAVSIALATNDDGSGSVEEQGVRETAAFGLAIGSAAYKSDLPEMTEATEREDDDDDASGEKSDEQEERKESSAGHVWRVAWDCRYFHGILVSTPADEDDAIIVSTLAAKGASGGAGGGDGAAAAGSGGTAGATSSQ
jgi:hypothetical protein